LFGEHPDEFRMVGVEIDPRKNWDHYAKLVKAKG
jgi:hypothetical protein